MTFNLLTTPWLEVRRQSGVRTVIRPCDVTSQFANDPILALDFPRPDWNAALTEFLIGLCTLALSPEDAGDWADLFEAPPEPEALEAKLVPFLKAFDFDGDGPRAYQDFDPLAAQELKVLNTLLIDAPGENALRNNSDLFIKRDGVGALSLPYAAAALITMQTYAPSGGKGHRTSLRGGGPLTTLLSPRRQGRKAATLWDRVWANVPEKDETALKTEPEEVFPWLTPTRTSVNDEMVTAADHHPALAFFACPRRIRLEFADNLTCDLSKASGKAATGFRTQNYGANYLHWQHPLSPYRDDKKSGSLPVHPHSGPSDYGDWLAWWGFDGRPAAPLVLWGTRRRRIEVLIAEPDGMDAVGYNIVNNMKAQQWLNASLPWIPVHEDSGKALKEALAQSVSASDLAAKMVTHAAKIALYGERKNGIDGYYKLPENLNVNALKEPGERLWRETEGQFLTHLASLQERLKAGEVATFDLQEQWLNTLKRQVLHIFDETVDSDGMTNADPRRLLWARGKLSFEFADHPKAGVRKALGLTATHKPKRDSA